MIANQKSDGMASSGMEMVERSYDCRSVWEQIVDIDTRFMASVVVGISSLG